jgi:ComF family protein
MVLEALAAAVFPARCPGCGAPAEPVCDACARRLRPALRQPPPAGVDDWVAVLAYEGVARELVARLKYRNARAVVPWLGTAMAAAVYAGTGSHGIEVVTWAPTTPVRRRERGFDHAELLARAVGRALTRPVRPTLRRRPGRPQTGLPSADRRRGPAFVARRVVPASVLVVDDVATTGATLRAAARALRAGGAQQVVAVTAARTPPRTQIHPFAPDRHGG